MGGVERCPTGILGFDKLCDGGFVRNSVNAILGGPGAGKTTFLLQFLWNGLRYKENGLFVSFEPDVSEVIEDAVLHGWDFARADANGTCKFIRFSTKASVDDLKVELMKTIAKNDVKRVCMDPASLISINTDGKETRELIYDLVSLLKRLRVTVLLSNEIPDGELEVPGKEDARDNYIRFLSDSFISLYSSGLGGVTDRALRIVKMRRTNHARGPVPFQITNFGVNVVSR